MRLESRKDVVVHCGGFQIPFEKGSQQDVEKEQGLWILSKYPDIFEVPLEKPKKVKDPSDKVLEGPAAATKKGKK